MSSHAEWNLVVCGGGSGGHLFPALAVIEQLRANPGGPADTLFITVDRPIEQRILTEQGFRQLALPAVSTHELWRRPWRSLSQLKKSVDRARDAIRNLNNAVILGTGGFASVPGVIAGWRQRRPIVLLEQNVVPGQATSLLSRLASVVCTSFSETSTRLQRRVRIVVTGNPVREAIGSLAKGFHEPASRPLLLVLGGSQGATALNDAVFSLVKDHQQDLRDWTILHQTGERDCERVAAEYRQSAVHADAVPFLDEMATVYQQAALVITRGGATSLAEIACAGVPAVIVPYPGSFRDHQRINAQWYADRGAAVLVEQNDDSAAFEQRLAGAVIELVRDQDRRIAMGRAMRDNSQPDAARRVADVVLELRTV